LEKLLHIHLKTDLSDDKVVVNEERGIEGKKCSRREKYFSRRELILAACALRRTKRLKQVEYFQQFEPLSQASILSK